VRPNRKFERDNNALHYRPSTLALGFSKMRAVDIRYASCRGLMTRRISMAALSIVLALSGCANNKFHRAEVAKEAQTALIGMQRRDLLSCAGAPVRQASDGDMEFLTYVGGGDGNGVAMGVATAPVGVAITSSKHRYCEVTFVLSNGMVQKVNYAGRTGGWASEGEQCAFVVENCVKPK
jgi:hypothetical protein